MALQFEALLGRLWGRVALLTTCRLPQQRARILASLISWGLNHTFGFILITLHTALLGALSLASCPFWNSSAAHMEAQFACEDNPRGNVKLCCQAKQQSAPLESGLRSRALQGPRCLTTVKEILENQFYRCPFSSKGPKDSSQMRAL